MHCCICSKVCWHVGGPFYCRKHDPERQYKTPYSQTPWPVSIDQDIVARIIQLEKKIDAIIEQFKEIGVA